MPALVLVFSPSEWLNRACFHWFAFMEFFIRPSHPQCGNRWRKSLSPASCSSSTPIVYSSDDEPGPRHPFRRLVRHGFRFRIAFLDARGDADEFQIGYPLGHGPVRQTYDDLLSPAIELGQLADAGAVHRFQVFAQFGDPVACESAHAQPLPIH